MEENKQQQINDLLKKIEKDLGKGSVCLGNEGFEKIERYTTGSMKLDNMIGGGWPKGRIVEIYGPESSGKTSVCLLTVAALQAEGKTCAYIDAEQALNPSWMKMLGINMDSLIFAQPNSGEEGLQLVKELAKSGIVDFIVVDSVAALVPQAELDGDLGDASIGLQARMMSKAMRMIAGEANKNGCTIVFINQLREKIGVMFGNPETTTGGKALKFYASIRLDVRKEVVKQGSDSVGQKIKIKSVKNKTYPPYKNTDLLLNYEKGFDKVQELLSVAVELGVVEKSGGWHSYKGDKLGNGEANVCELLRNDEVLLEELKNDVKEKMLTN